MSVPPRTTSAAVQAVLTNDWDMETDLAPFIEAATEMMDEVALCAISHEEPHTAGRLELIERWLSAHFYKYACDRQFQQRSVQGATVGGGFTGQPQFTTYLDTAFALDTTGCLRALMLGQRARATWLGKPFSDQIPYDQRS